MASTLSIGRKQSHGDEESTCNATGKHPFALKRFHLVFFNTYTDRSPLSWRRGCSPRLGVRFSSEYYSTHQRGAMQCNATSVGSQPLETIIYVDRNASTLRPMFAPREIRAWLCKILPCRSRTTTMPTFPEFSACERSSGLCSLKWKETITRR